jgi:hypothetical protein
MELQMENITGSFLTLINRRSYSTFRNALLHLPDVMGRADWCLVPPGDAPSSKRFYDAISHYCLPYLLADQFYLPYEDIYVDYETFVRQLPADRVNDMAEDVKKVSENEIKQRRKALGRVQKRFIWDYEEKPKAGQALWTLSWALYDRFRMISPYLNNEMTVFESDPS